MNAETSADPNLLQKGKRKKSKKKKAYSVKFDKEGFFVAWGLALVLAAIGIYINNGVIKTNPEGAFNINSINTNHKLVGFFPESGKDTMMFIFGSLFIFGAIICIFLGLRIVVQYIVGKQPKYGKTKKSNLLKGFRKLFPG